MKRSALAVPLFALVLLLALPCPAAACAPPTVWDVVSHDSYLISGIMSVIRDGYSSPDTANLLDDAFTVAFSRYDLGDREILELIYQFEELDRLLGLRSPGERSLADKLLARSSATWE